MGNNASTGTSTTTNGNGNGNGNGNRSRSRSRNRRRRRHRSLQHPQSQITGNDAVDADSAIRSSQYPNALSPGGVQPSITVNLGDRQLPCGPVSPMMAPFVEHQKAVTIRNSVNIKKETLRIEPDQDQPGSFLLSFIFDATTPGSITVMFFAKETIDGDLVAVNGAMLKQISMPFEQGLCQKFIQSSGTGIDFSMLEETALKIEGDSEVYPLVVKAEALPSNIHETGGNPSFQITLASFEKREKGDYKVQVLKQILWVNGNRYELQEIYGIGNAGDGDFDDVESGRACVICLSEPRDITVLPCRHMCMCSGCAKLLKSHNCPICRHPVERLLEIMVDNGSGNR